MPTPATPHDDAHHLALKARYARFDRRFFTGVTSTRIYRLPVCKARTPKRENCRFFAQAAQAQRAGFRPCLRCRPALAPRGGLEGAHWAVQDACIIPARESPRSLDGIDVALHTALGLRNTPLPAKATDSAFAAFAPWRSHALVRAWHTLAHPGAPTP